MNFSASYNGPFTKMIFLFLEQNYKNIIYFLVIGAVLSLLLFSIAFFLSSRNTKDKEKLSDYDALDNTSKARHPVLFISFPIGNNGLVFDSESISHFLVFLFLFYILYSIYVRSYKTNIFAEIFYLCLANITLLIQVLFLLSIRPLFNNVISCFCLLTLVFFIFVCFKFKLIHHIKHAYKNIMNLIFCCGWILALLFIFWSAIFIVYLVIIAGQNLYNIFF